MPKAVYPARLGLVLLSLSVLLSGCTLPPPGGRAKPSVSLQAEEPKVSKNPFADLEALFDSQPKREENLPPYNPEARLSEAQLRLPPLQPWKKDSRLLISDTDEARKLAAAIEQAIQESGIREEAISIFYRSESGLTVLSLNGKQKRVAASTIKLPLALYTLDTAGAGETALDTKLTLTEDDMTSGSGRLQYERVGTEYTLKTLLYLSIVDSDNVATNMLHRWLSAKIGKDSFAEMRQRFGLPPAKEGENLATAEAMVRIWLELEKNPRHNPYYFLLESWLKEARMTYLGAGFPWNAVFAHKYGLYYGNYGEVAHFTDPGNAAFVAVYIKDESEGQTQEQPVLELFRKLGLIFLHPPK